jgi:DNA-binding response OmpR family regulator
MSHKIVLVCDHPEKMARWQHLSSHYPQGIHIDVATSYPDLVRLVDAQRPHAIVIDALGPCNDHIGWLRDLRHNKTIDKIPVYVYAGEPGDEDLTELLKRVVGQA